MHGVMKSRPLVIVYRVRRTCARNFKKLGACGLSIAKFSVYVSAVDLMILSTIFIRSVAWDDDVFILQTGVLPEVFRDEAAAE
jgi:hypothetical protein